MKKIFHYLGFFLILATADHFLKFLFLKNSICNQNIAWSIPIAPGVFYFFWLIIFFLLTHYFLKSKKYFEKTALAFILSGASSNMIDRLARGCVIDFIDFKIFPVFNLADIYITIGVLAIILSIIKSQRREATP